MGEAGGVRDEVGELGKGSLAHGKKADFIHCDGKSREGLNQGNDMRGDKGQRQEHRGSRWLLRRKMVAGGVVRCKVHIFGRTREETCSWISWSAQGIELKMPPKLLA